MQGKAIRCCAAPLPAPAVGHAGEPRTGTEAGLAGIGGRRTAPVGAPGDWSAEPDLCVGAEGAGLNKVLRYAIMEGKKSVPSYSEERREAARKFVREHNSAERLSVIKRD